MVSKLKKAACSYGILLHHTTDDCEKRVKGERYLAFLGPVAMTCFVKNVFFKNFLSDKRKGKLWAYMKWGMIKIIIYI